MRTAPPVQLSRAERADLERWSARPSRSTRLEGRARIVLAAARGRRNTEIAAEVGVHPGTVARWRTRFLVGGIDGLRREAPRGGHAARIPAEFVERILTKTLNDRPPGSSAWSTRSLARSLQVNHMMVHRVWTAYRLTDASPGRPGSAGNRLPHVDLVGVFVGPSSGAVVFTVDRRRHRAGPGASWGPTTPTPGEATAPGPDEDALARLDRMLRRAESGRPAGTSCRGAIAPLLVFLRTVEGRAPRSARLDVVLDRPLASTDRRVEDWLAVHPRFHVFTTPPGEPWSHEVAGWIARWDRTLLQRSSFRGIAACLASFGSMMASGARPGPARAWIRIGPARRVGVRLRLGPANARGRPDATPSVGPRRRQGPGGERDRARPSERKPRASL